MPRPEIWGFQLRIFCGIFNDFIGSFGIAKIRDFSNFFFFEKVL
jgi:hypothetical protein